MSQLLDWGLGSLRTHGIRMFDERILRLRHGSFMLPDVLNELTDRAAGGRRQEQAGNSQARPGGEWPLAGTPGGAMEMVHDFDSSHGRVAGSGVEFNVGDRLKKSSAEDRASGTRPPIRRIAIGRPRKSASLIRLAVTGKSTTRVR